METVRKLSIGLLSNDVDSWATGVNRNLAHKQTRVLSRYSGSAPDFRAHCNAVAANGYRELQLD
jgi:hypothetical protein